MTDSLVSQVWFTLGSGAIIILFIAAIPCVAPLLAGVEGGLPPAKVED